MSLGCRRHHDITLTAVHYFTNGAPLSLFWKEGKPTTCVIEPLLRIVTLLLQVCPMILSKQH